MLVKENICLVFHQGVFYASGLAELGLGHDPTVAEEMAYLLRAHLNFELLVRKGGGSPGKHDPWICFYYDKILELSETFSVADLK